MKRIVSTLLAVCMILCTLAILAACGEDHTHTYKTEWATDKTHHWHQCETADCTAISDKAAHSFANGVCVCGYEEVSLHTCVFNTEWTSDITHHWHSCESNACSEISDYAEHIWNEGQITVEATADEVGEKTYTCTVCESTKKEVIEFSGINRTEWESLLNSDLYRNCTLTATMLDSALKQVNIGKFVDGLYYVYAAAYDRETNELVSQSSTVLEIPSNAVINTENLFLFSQPYDKIEYDIENDVYRYTEDYLAGEEGTTKTIYRNTEFSLKEGKLWKLYYEEWFVDGENSLMHHSISLEFTDYGTTVAPTN